MPTINAWGSQDPAQVAKGGTGSNSFTIYGPVVAASTTTGALTSLAAGSTNQVLQSGGASANPAWSTATYPATATGTGTILRADGTNWSATSATYPNSTTLNQILYSSSANTVAGLATATNGVLITDGTTGIPSISSTLPSAVQGNITSTGTISSGTWAGTTIAIAHGGTNATSFTQSAGIVVYNGTSLVNYAGPQISSSGVATNSAQPAFHAYVNGNVSNVTGDSTVYTIVYNSTLFDQASNFTTGSGTFTAPVTGKYQFNITLSIFNISASYTTAVLSLVTTGGTYVVCTQSPGKTFETQSGSAELMLSGSVFVSMTATNTATVTVSVSGSTKSIGVIGGANNQNKFSGYLVC